MAYETQPLCFSLCRPYFDLAPVGSNHPLHAYEPHLIAELLEAGAAHRLGPNMSMPPTFRELLVQESGLHRYAALTPLDLAPELRGERWTRLCQYLEHWAELDAPTRGLVGRLLLALTFHRAALRWLDPPPPEEEIARSPELALLAWLRCYARFLTAAQFDSVPMDLLQLAVLAPRASMARWAARSLLVSIYVLYLRELDAAGYWLDQVSGDLPEVAGGLEPEDAVRLRVRYLVMRARYLQAAGQPGAREVLEEATGLVRDLPTATPTQRVLRDEALRRILDRQAEVAAAAGDLETALRYASAAVEVDPHDAKAHFLLGNLLYRTGDVARALTLYRRAARLGPLATAEAWFMAGQCHERLNQPEAAVDCYIAAVRADPLALSPLLALIECAGRLNLPAVRAWALTAAESLQSQRTLPAPSGGVAAQGQLER